MTAIEKLRKDCPGLVEGGLYRISLCLCPSDFGYLEDPKECDESSISCRDCWTREMNGEEEEE